LETVEARAHHHHEAAIRDYLRILWQRKWIALIPIVLVPLAALYFSFKQERLYQASSEVSVRSQNSALTVLGLPATYEDPDRFLQDQIELARTYAVATRVAAIAGNDVSPGEVLAGSSVEKKSDSNVLIFRVTKGDPDLAARISAAYARGFAQYKREQDAGAFRRARQQLDRQIADLGPVGRRSALFENYQTLLQQRQQLTILENLQENNTAVLRAASGAGQTQPRPKRNAALGFGLGIFLGIGLAFLWHALDTRVRSADQIGASLGLPLLGRIPTPGRRQRRSNQIAMLADPSGAQAEAFRVLRTNIEFATLGHSARTIMVTSAVEREGKSTTAVNAAVAFARAGKRVVLLDLDLRRPMIDRLFGLEGRPGVTDVALGHASLEEAITPVALTEGGAARAEGNGDRGGMFEGLLEVVTSGPIPPNPGEFMSSARLAEILDDLRERAEIVMIDTAPLLRVGDTMALSRRVEGIILLTRLHVLRRGMLSELRRALDTSPAAKLGFVITGAEAEEGYEYRGYYRYGVYGRREGQRVA
jgi:Mrp family chromosome partitioning ATPase